MLMSVQPVPPVPTAAAVHVDAKFAEAERLVALDLPGRAVYRRLTVLRTRLAAEVGVKPYHVYTNRQLIDHVCRRVRAAQSAVSNFVRLPNGASRRSQKQIRQRKSDLISSWRIYMEVIVVAVDLIGKHGPEIQLLEIVSHRQPRD